MFTVLPVFSQMVMGAREEGLSEATSALQADRWALFGNPANLAEHDEAAFFAMRHFGFSELTDYAFEMNIPSTLLSVGLGIHTFGFRLFRQSDFRFGFSKKIQFLHVGLVIKYIRYSFPQPYGSAGAFGVNIGISIQMLHGLWLGTRANNINRPEIGKAREPLPQALSIGLAYHLSPKALYLIECYKDIDFPVSVRSGIEVEPVRVLSFRVGIKSYPESFSAGLGIHRKKMNLNIAMVHHLVLGWSPGVDFDFSW